MQTIEKWVTRSDAWTSDDDERLTGVVLRHIRTGSTQLRAFEQAANELGRTAAACGYRWNGVLRKHHREQIESAKRDRKVTQKGGLTEPVISHSSEPTHTTINSSESMKDVIKFLSTFDEQYQKLRMQLDASERERLRLLDRLQAVEMNTVQSPVQNSVQSNVPTMTPAANNPISPAQLEEDSKTLFAIMERARKLLGQETVKSKAE